MDCKPKVLPCLLLQNQVTKVRCTFNADNHMLVVLPFVHATMSPKVMKLDAIGNRLVLGNGLDEFYTEKSAHIPPIQDAIPASLPL